MLEWFTQLADWLTFSVMGLAPEENISKSIHFFIEDTSKILVLLVLLIYAISFVRATLNPEKVRYYLQGKNRFLGYLLGSSFGAVTPFCSCSSIPLFMGFVSARIPLGVTIAFLLTSPLINEIAIVMLGSLLGIKFTVMYVVIGMSLGMFAGFLVDLFQGHRYLVPFLAKKYEATEAVESLEFVESKMDMKARHEFAKEETITVFSRIWKWVFIGVGIGALIHGMIPAAWFQENLGNGQWWTVPLAALMGIPMYVNATSIIPIMGALIEKGVPLGTTLAFCMSGVAVSLPEFMMLKQVMQVKLLLSIAFYLLIALTAMGWIFNAVAF